MTEQLPAWPRDTTYVRVTREHVIRGRIASLTHSAVALAVADAIGRGVAIVSADVDVITAHEIAAPFRSWHAETPEEVAEWQAELDSGDDERKTDAAGAAALQLLDFELTWTEGAATAAGTEEQADGT